MSIDQADGRLCRVWERVRIEARGSGPRRSPKSCEAPPERSLLLSLKIGDEQAGQECSVRVAPCLSKSAIFLIVSFSSVMSTLSCTRFTVVNMFCWSLINYLSSFFVEAGLLNDFGSINGINCRA